MTGFLHYEDRSWKRRQPLKYRSGDEKAETIVLAQSTVALDDNARRLVVSGQLLCEITSSGKYGPYDKTETDGRQTLAKGKAVIAVEGVDITLGDRAIGGWFADCVFDRSELTLSGVSLHGASLTALEAAFPQCTFSD